MKDDNQSLIAALCENMLIVSMLLSVFFNPGDVADCPNPILIANIPQNIEALSGSCLQIPCRFSTTHSSYINSRSVYGLWLKTNAILNPSHVIFNSSGSVNVYSLKMIGNLSEEDCTTLFPNLKASYNDNYYLRIQKGEFKSTDVCHPLHITVKDSPWSPSINVPSDLKEHQSVTVTCSAFTPCPHSPPELTWNLQQDSLRQTERNTDGTFTTKIQENITLSDTHDGYNITCSARYPVIGGNKTAETEVTLSVSYAPRNTSASISPSGLVSAGSWVELSCSSRAKPPPRFIWFRKSKHGAINVSVGPVYSFNATEEGEFYCLATNDLGNETSPVHLRIEGILHGPLFWLLIALAIGLLVLICLVLYVRCFKSKQPAPQQTQTPAGEEAAVQTPSTAAEELQYGEVTFFKRKPEASSTSEEYGKQEETVYAHVRVSKSRKCSTHTTDSPDDIYAQVKKK